MSSNSYENAAKDIEQEKKMVAALKRLSIGNLMNYDPDLPPDEFEFQYQYDDLSFDEHSLSSSKEATSLSRAKSSKRTPTTTRKSSMSEQIRFDDLEEEPLKRERSHSSNEFLAREEDDEHVVDYVNPLLWVPANLHPEVDPEQFKMHLKTTVEDLMEKKLSRSNSQSKRSSLSFSSSDPIDFTKDPQSLAREGGDVHEADISGTSSHEGVPSLAKRNSNPSLRDLTNELEKLSKLAGMDSSDAVTLARTLSTTSLGYTDVEKQAFDEMTSSPKKSDQAPAQHQLLQSYGEPSGRKDNSRNRSHDQSRQQHSSQYYQGPPQKLYPHQSQQQQPPQQRQQGYSRNHSPQESSDFALKRSRRLDYRKNTSPLPAASGSSLQQHKAEKLNELRNNLSTTLSPDVGSTPASSSSKRSHKTKSYSQLTNRSSQMLFSYRNPNVPPHQLHQPHQKSRGSPYPPSASSQLPIDQLGNYTSSRRISPLSNQHRNGSNEHLYGQQQQTQIQTQSQQRGNAAYSGAAAVPHIKDKVRQSRQISPNQQLHQQLRSQLHQQPQYKGGQPQSQSRRISSLKQYQQGYPQQQQQQSYVPTPYQQYPQQNSQNYQQHPLHRNYSPETQGQLHRSPSFSSKPSSQHIVSKVNNKSRELNQNLDLLRSEINEFKESLSKSDPNGPLRSSSQKGNKAPTIEPISQENDFSFDTSYQDISYEDSLGIERDVLQELNLEKIVEPEPEPDLELDLESDSGFNDAIEASIYPRTPDLVQNEYTANIPETPDNPIPSVQDKSVPPPDEDIIDDRVSSGSIKSPTTSPTKKKKAFNLLSSSPVIEDKSNITQASNSLQGAVSGKTLKKKKSWAWLTDRSANTNTNSPTVTATTTNNNDNVDSLNTGLPKSPTSPVQDTDGPSSPSKLSSRSVSNPEINERKKVESVVQRRSSESMSHNNDKDSISTVGSGSTSTGKENMISKLFKKKRLTSSSMNSSQATIVEEEEKNPIRGSGVTVDYESDTENRKEKKKSASGIFKKKSKKDKSTIPLSISNNSISSFISGKSKEDEESKKKNQDEEIEIIDEIEKVNEEETDETPGVVTTSTTVVESTTSTTTTTTIATEEKLQSTQEVQEKLKRSIKRSSRANQPLEFTDSAFGFPLPPPSQSTLVMLDYRFPVHVERAIYRLSHLKLANPKRSLREQVLLSNFMYAYLNLVDHTLHLEQQQGEGTDNNKGLEESMNNEENDGIIYNDEQMLGQDVFEREDDGVTIDLDVANVDNMTHIEV